MTTQFIVAHMPHPALTHWGQVTYICVDKIIIIDSDNGLLQQPPVASSLAKPPMSLIGCVLFMDMYGLIVSQVASVLSSNE